MKKTALCFIFWLMLTLTWAQEKSVFLPDISISAPAIGKKSIDSSRFLSHENSMVDGLRLSSEIFIKNYGPGASASLGIRGTAAAHSTILWKGIPIGNPILAMVDLSLLPGLLLENAQIRTGGPALAGFSGNFGGFIALKTGNEEGRNRIRFGSSIGSFGQFQNWITAEQSFQKANISLRTWHQQAKNDFRYQFEKEKRRQFHAEKRDLGLIAEIDIKLNSKWRLKPAIWLQQVNREIGPAVFESNADAIQADKSLRIANQFSQFNSNSELEISHAFAFQRLNYESKLAGIDSRNEVYENFIQARFQHKIQRFQFGIQGFQTISKAVSSNFSGTPEQRKTEFLAKTMVDLKPEILVLKGQVHALTYQHTEISNSDIFILPSVFLEFKNKYPGTFSIGIARKARIPSLNDLFWFNAGNSDLKSEHGWNLDFNWEKLFKISENLTVSNRSTAFAAQIVDFIQWIPNGGIWSPNNLAAVQIRGFSLHPQAEWKTKKINLQVFGQFQLTQSIQTKSRFPGDNSVGNQMMYVPVFNSVLGFKSSVKGLEGIFWIEKTGIRYTDSSNESSLPSYSLVNARLSFKSDFFQKMGLNAFFEGLNLLGQSYQSVKGFPMPLRQLKFGIILSYQ